MFIHDALLEALFCGDTVIPATHLLQYWRDTKSGESEYNRVANQYKVIAFESRVIGSSWFTNRFQYHFTNYLYQGAWFKIHLSLFIIYGRGLLLFKPITSLHFIFTTIEYGTIDDDHCLLKGRTF